MKRVLVTAALLLGFVGVCVFGFYFPAAVFGILGIVYVGMMGALGWALAGEICK